MKVTVRYRLSGWPDSFWTMGLWSGLIHFLSALCRGQDLNRYSIIWLPVSQGHCSVWPIWNFVNKWWLRWLFPVLSLNITTCFLLGSRWYWSEVLPCGCCSWHRLSCSALMTVLASVYLVDMSVCSFSDLTFARKSAALFLSMFQWLGIHCMMTVWLVQREARTEHRSFSFVLLPDCGACSMDKASVRITTSLEEWEL